MQLTTQLERALARITAYRQLAPPADHASHYEERSRARPPVLSPLPLKANTETSDEMCFTVIATPKNRAGIVSRGVASRLTISTAAPWSKTPSKNCGTQRESTRLWPASKTTYPVFVNTHQDPKSDSERLATALLNLNRGHTKPW